MKLNKKFIIIFLLAATLAGGAYFYFNKNADQSENLPSFVPVSRGSIEQVVTSQGKLEPKEFVDVGAQVSGQLTKIHVELGDSIQQGAIIAEIDDSIYLSRVQGDEARLKTLRAQLAEQQAQITYAKNQYDRNDRLLKAQAVSKQVLEDAQTNFKVAEARAASIKAQIEEAESTLAANKANLNFTKIYAPISGTVVVQTSREGQTLNANQTAPVIVQLANLDTMTVRAQVAEADVMNLEPGMEVYFTTLGNQVRKWYGVTRQILPSPEIINEVVLYNVLVDVDIRAAEEALKAANADIGIARAALFPSLNLTGSISSLGSPSIAPLLSSGFVASLAQTVFNGGRLQGQVQQATARQLELVENYRGRVLNAFLETENALIAEKSASNRQENFTNALTEARKSYAIARDRYMNGADDFLNLLDAQRSLLQAEDSFAQAQLERLLAVLNLYRAMGGGWQS